MARTIKTGMGIDTRELRAFSRALRRASPLAQRRFRESLAASGEIVAREARSLAGAHSQEIPSTIKTRVYGVAVSVQAGSSAVPLAGLYELGNKGCGGGGSPSSTFRHPVFGNKNAWVEQPRYPFLEPAMEKKLPEVEAAVLAATDDAVRVIQYGR